jgi:putative tricarboxylic transport membrane protein
MTVSLRRLEIGVAVALALLGAFAAWEASRMPSGTAALPGPAMMPMAVGVLLALAAIGVIAFRSAGVPSDDPVALGNRSIVLAVAAIVVAGLLFERVGFLVTSSLFVFTLLWSLSALGWWRSLIAAVVASLVARSFFQDLLNVRLPPFPFGS